MSNAGRGADSTTPSSGSRESANATPEQSINIASARNNNSNNARNNNDRRRNSRGVTSIVQSVDEDFQGKTPEIGGVLVLKSEKVSKKVPFEVFRELLVERLSKELDNSRDAIAIVRDMVDPKDLF